jgi:serine/threonine protein phosphatase PrpC
MNTEPIAVGKQINTAAPAVQPLPVEGVPVTPSGIRLTAFGRTDVGKVRTNNEDAFVVSELTAAPSIHAMASSVVIEVGNRGVLLAVSDGMGGEHAGEVASALALHALRQGMSTVTATSAEEALRACVERANHEVWTAASVPGRAGMGATLTAVLVVGTNAYIAEIGDSRAYLLRADRLLQLTRDQSLVQKLVDNGALTRAQADTCEYKNVILQAMGVKPDVVVALNRLPLRRGDRFLLCSDGLSGKVSEDEIEAVMVASEALESACTKLIDMALQRGGEDNVTVLLAEVDGESVPALTGVDRLPLEALKTLVPA